MHKFLSIFPAILIGTCLFGQNKIANYVKENMTSIDFSIDSSTDSTFKIIGKSIGATRLVLLGEQDHGDAETFLIKSALVKYLHEKLSFDLLVFEGDFFAFNQGWENTGNKDSTKQRFLRENIMPMWSKCYACNDLLYNYIPKNKSLEISGMDSQMFSNYSKRNLTGEIFGLIQKLNLPLSKKSKDRNALFSALKRISQTRPYKEKDSKEYIDNQKSLERLQREAAVVLKKSNFSLQLINNLLSYNEELNVLNFSTFEASVIRDEQMFKNLEWIRTNKFPDKKVIVWSANVHVAKYFDAKHHYKTTGKLLDQAKTKFYNIGFTSFTGHSGWVGHKSFPIKKPKKNSFESWVDSKIKYGFIDFSKYNKFNKQTNKFFMNSWKYYPLKASWNKIYDGIFFIKTMKSCSQID